MLLKSPWSTKLNAKSLGFDLYIRYLNNLPELACGEQIDGVELSRRIEAWDLRWQGGPVRFLGLGREASLRRLDYH